MFACRADVTSSDQAAAGKSAADHMGQQDEFCEMERERLKRIERNQAMMKMLEVRGGFCVQPRVLPP